MTFLRFIPETTNINFVKWRYVAFAIDGILLVVAAGFILFKGFNLGIDFAGGVLIEAKAAHIIDISSVRSQLGSKGFNDIQVQYVGGGTCDRPANSCVLIRAKPGAGQTESEVAETIKSKLGSEFTIRNSQVIGPKVSGELFHDSVMATLMAVVLISIYVAVRFEWQYGVGALIATGHDVFVTAGFYSVLQLDFSIT